MAFVPKLLFVCCTWQWFLCLFFPPPGMVSSTPPATMIFAWYKRNMQEILDKHSSGLGVHSFISTYIFTCWQALYLCISLVCMLCIYITKGLLCCGIKNCCILLGVAAKHYNLNCVKLARSENTQKTALYTWYASDTVPFVALENVTVTPKKKTKTWRRTHVKLAKNQMHTFC